MLNVEFLYDDENLIKALDNFKENWLSSIDSDKVKKHSFFPYQVLKDETNNPDILKEFIKTELSTGELTRLLNSGKQYPTTENQSYDSIELESDVPLYDVISELNNHFVNIRQINSIECYEPYSYKGWHTDCVDNKVDLINRLSIVYNDTDDESVFLVDGGGVKEKKGWNFHSTELSNCLVDKATSLSWNSEYNFNNNRYVIRFMYDMVKQTF